MKVSGLGVNSILMQQISKTSAQMTKLQTQLASGKVSETYGGLGTYRNFALSLQQQISQISSYQDTITLANTRIEVMSTVVEGLRDHATSARSDLLVAGFEVIDNGQTLAQSQAKTRLADTFDLLNTEVGGRYLFAGTETDGEPVLSSTSILEGESGKAGFRQIMDERLQADIGSDGMGRLDLSPSGASVNLAEDAAGSPFGFKIDSAVSDLTGVTITGPAGSPTGIDVAFSSPLPNEGESITVQLSMPDGTTTNLTLTAGNSSALEDGEFAIGADANQTATNFATALENMIKEQAATELTAASYQAAANDFFTGGTDIPQRVDGPPFDTATALRDATDTDTVRWYKGEISDSSARETALAKVDDNQVVAYGARADEDAFTTLIKQLAVMATAEFDQDEDTAYAAYSSMTDRVADSLSYSVKGQSIDRISGELAIAQNAIGQASERHTATDNLMTNYLAEIETTDTEQAAAKLLSLQTQLQASYQVTSLLSDMSLVNFL